MDNQDLNKRVENYKIKQDHYNNTHITLFNFVKYYLKDGYNAAIKNHFSIKMHGKCYGKLSRPIGLLNIDDEVNVEIRGSQIIIFLTSDYNISYKFKMINKEPEIIIN